MEQMEQMTIGQVAKKVDVNIDTIRFYEKHGIIPKSPRKESGYRLFSQDIIARIQFIKRAKELGFTLREIKELLSLRVDKKRSCHDIKDRAEAKVADIDVKISDLLRMKNALVNLASQCHGTGPTSECPILEAMEKSD